MTPTVRSREPADLDGCVRLLRAVHEHSGYPTHWPADPVGWLTPSPLLGCWVVEQEGELLGHVGLLGAGAEVAGRAWAEHTGNPPNQAAAVTRLCVRPDARGRGLGAALLARTLADADRRGLAAVLDVLDRDRATVAVYQHLGWRRLDSVWTTLSDGQHVLTHCFAAPN